MELHIKPLTSVSETGFSENILSFGHTQLVQKDGKFFLYAGLQKEGLTIEDVRFLGGKLRKAIADFSVDTVQTDFSEWIGHFGEYFSEKDIVTAFMEGWYLSGYQFLAYKGQEPKKSPKFPVAGPYIEYARLAKVRAEAVNLARDLCNEPANKLTPAVYAKRLETVFADSKVAVEIISGQALIEQGFEAIATVGKGSSNPPRLAVLTFKNSDSKHIGLVGKGVTFDSGGTNVKTGGDIAEMKMDMGGSAAVVGAMKLLADLDAPVHVTAVLPLVENVADGNAYLPSDVISYKNGKTVEVGNTDAEGRLVLADGMLHAQSQGAETIIDIATLTGAIGTALGLKVAGIFSNHEEDLWAYKTIGETTGDYVWPMPVVADYQSLLKSDSADFNNMSSSKFGGAITAAVFLSNFVEAGRKWVHIDMANTVSPWKQDGYYGPGASGFGVRLLADLVMREGQ